MDSKQFRGCRDASVGFAHRSANQLFFGLIERLVVSSPGKAGRLFFEEAFRKIFRPDLFRQSHYDGMLNRVLHLTDISRPAIADQERTRFLRDAFEGPLTSFRILGGKVESQ